MTRIRIHPMSVGPTAFGSFQVQCSPLSHGCLVAYSKAYRGGELTEHFDFGPITPKFYQDALPGIEELSEPGIFLFSSYMWNHDVNLIVAGHVKRRLPNALVIFGGPQVPKQRLALLDFLRRNECVDMVVRGEGEEALAEILETIARSGVSADGLLACDFSGVAGVTYRHSGLVEAPDRARPKSLEEFPSPYLTGLFDHWIDAMDYMGLETNRGCPYGCTFCDWGAATLSKIRTMSLERVFGEIDYAGQHKIRSIFICDANFGILKRDVEIAARIVEARERYGYPALVSYNNAKAVRPEFLTIVKMLRDAGLNTLGQIAIQTTDAEVLKIVKRSNIKTSEFDKLVEFFHEEGIPTLSDVMLGLPGQTLDTCKTDLQFMFNRKIYARVFATAVMPNAPMNDPEYRKQYEIEVDSEGIVLSTFSLSKSGMDRTLDFSYAFKLFASTGVGVFKYLMLFMQLDRGVRAVDYMDSWLRSVDEAPDRYPVSRRFWQHALDQRGPRWRELLQLSWGDESGEVLFGDLDSLFAEALAIYASCFAVDVAGGDVAAVVEAQKALLPSRDTAERLIELAHDVPAYFTAVRGLVNVEQRPDSWKPLCEYGPGTLRVEARRPTLAFNDFMAPYVKLESPSNMLL
jgi:radical SAM superfamily enzyme YgiQ (UPF0313 family)